jgi:putative lipase involved disintegration of autophagic bodies
VCTGRRDGDAVWDVIKTAKDTIHRRIEVWFCGHSLGGVVAKLFHHRYRFDGDKFKFPGRVKASVQWRRA